MKPIIWRLFLLVLTFPAFIFLTRSGYYNMHDDMQVVRQLEMEKCLQDGQIPCRWTPDLGYGYGYPLFNYYPPLPYFIGQIFRFLHFSILDSIKLTAILQIILTTQIMFTLGTSLFGNLGGFIAAILYTYAPYHALNIYVRGAMNEAWAATFFPLIFYAARRLILFPSILSLLLLSFSYGLLLLSHNPMALVFAPFLFIWIVYIFLIHSHPQLIWKTIRNFFLSALLSLGLVSFFTLPVIVEANLVQIESMFTGYYHFSAHFATFRQLFLSNYWGDGPSVWGTNDGMSFMIGYLHWILPLLILLFFLLRIIKKKSIPRSFWLFTMLLCLGFFTAFLSHERSTPLWLLFSPIQKIQFPWRFINLSLFFLSLSVGSIFMVLRLKLFQRLIITFCLVVLTLIFNQSYFHPLHFGPVTDRQKLSGKSWQLLITASIYDYLPKTAKSAAKNAPENFIDNLDPPLTIVTQPSLKQGTDWALTNFTLDRQSVVTFALLNFPNWVIYDQGIKINYSYEPEFGRLTVPLGPGQHQLYFKLTNTPIRAITNYLSLISWTIFIFLFLTHARHRRKN